MIGRKTVDRVDEVVHAPDHPNSRYLEPQIDPGQRLTAGMVFNERTNMAVNPNDAVSSHISTLPVVIPNTSMPNPTTHFPARAESPCGSVSERIEEQRRRTHSPRTPDLCLTTSYRNPQYTCQRFPGTCREAQAISYGARYSAGRIRRTPAGTLDGGKAAMCGRQGDGDVDSASETIEGESGVRPTRR